MLYIVSQCKRQLAAFVDSEDAAGFVALLGENGSVACNGRLVWAEGRETTSASDSYEAAGEIMTIRAQGAQR